MNKLLKKTLKIILPILLGGFILYWVYRDFDFSKAEEVLLHQTNWVVDVVVLVLRCDEPCVTRLALEADFGAAGCSSQNKRLR